MNVSPLPQTAPVMDIARCSLHDGEGIRTVVYLKGCSLACVWCHNPEGLRAAPQVLAYPSRCIGCGRCIRVCPAGCHRVEMGGKAFLRDACTLCMQCVQACPANALRACGVPMTSQEVFDEILKDIHFFAQSGGGVTFSGGECLLYPDFVAETMAKCREMGIHTCVESALHVPWAAIDAARNLTDVFIVDMKHADSAMHQQMTGAGNERIVANLQRLSRRHPALWVRIPLIPRMNDSDASLAEIARILRSLGEGLIKVELLPYNSMAKSKYDALDMQMPFFAPHTQSKSELAHKRQVLAEHLCRDVPVV